MKKELIMAKHSRRKLTVIGPHLGHGKKHHKAAKGKASRKRSEGKRVSR
jgi:hypothetical protein